MIQKRRIMSRRTNDKDSKKYVTCDRKGKNTKVNDEVKEAEMSEKDRKVKRR